MTTDEFKGPQYCCPPGMPDVQKQMDALLSDNIKLREALERIYKFELTPRHPLDTLSEHRGSIIWRMKEIARQALKGDIARTALGKD